MNLSMQIVMEVINEWFLFLNETLIIAECNWWVLKNDLDPDDVF